ncbi:uncharacterized protein METZ01_LOCUS259500, partial [marine metagenome]
KHFSLIELMTSFSGFSLDKRIGEILIFQIYKFELSE